MEETETCQIVEERVAVAAVVRWQAILDVEAKWKAEEEEMGTEQGGRFTLKQKERAEGKQVTCDCCVTWGAECQVSGC